MKRHPASPAVRAFRRMSRPVVGWPKNDRWLHFAKGSAIVTLRDRGPRLYLWYLWVPPEDRGRGVGSAALKALLRLARAHRVELHSHVAPIGNDGPSAAQLRAWYAAHGFQVYKNGRMEFRP